MLALFFEVRSKPGHESHYLARAAALRPILETQSGLLFIDRYRSLARPDVILSHSLWRDEDAITGWRTQSQHRAAQAAGREVHFGDYRIRIAAVEEAWPTDSPERRKALDAGVHVVAAVSREEQTFDHGETFASLNNASTWLTLCGDLTGEQGRELIARAKTHAPVDNLKLCSIVRDYGMFERDQAPPGPFGTLDASA